MLIFSDFKLQVKQSIKVYLSMKHGTAHNNVIVIKSRKAAIVLKPSQTLTW